jgi:hypothetical protein
LRKPPARRYNRGNGTRYKGAPAQNVARVFALTCFVHKSSPDTYRRRSLVSHTGASAPTPFRSRRPSTDSMLLYIRAPRKLLICCLSPGPSLHCVTGKFMLHDKRPRSVLTYSTYWANRTPLQTKTGIRKL